MIVSRYVNLDERDHKNWLVDDQAAWLTNQLDIRITMRKIQHRLRYTATIFHHRNNWKCCIEAMLCRGQLLFPAHKKQDMVGQEKEGGCAIINVWPSGTDSLHPWIFFCTRKATALFPLLHQGGPTLESFSGGVHLGMGKKGNLTSSSTFLFDNQNIF